MRFDDLLSEDCLDRLSLLVPREMRRAIMTAFGNASITKRETVLPEDFQIKGNKKKPMGFVQ